MASKLKNPEVLLYVLDQILVNFCPRLGQEEGCCHGALVHKRGTLRPTLNIHNNFLARMTALLPRERRFLKSRLKKKLEKLKNQNYVISISL